jgi:rRNA maturation protein Nop10
MTYVKVSITAICPKCGKENKIAPPPKKVCVHYRGYRNQLLEAEFRDLEGELI